MLYLCKIRKEKRMNRKSDCEAIILSPDEKRLLRKISHHPHTKCDRSEVAGLSSMGLIKADRDESVDITYQPMHMLDTYCVTDFYRIYEEYLRQSRKSELFKSLWLPIIVSLVTTLTVNALQWLWPLLSRWFSNSLV